MRKTNHIKSLHIEGFKKFDLLDISFNEHMNILVGENEAGKSTVLEAIRIVLNQQYRTADKSVLKDLFNIRKVKEFENDPCAKTLPKIVIEIYLSLDPRQKNSSFFHGEVYGERRQQKEEYGIRFECRYDAELGAGMEQFVSDGNIPYEYYSLTWMTFGNRSYQTIRRPFCFLFIDTSSNATMPSFNYYNKSLFSSKYDEATQAKAKNEFRVKIDSAFESVALPPISENRKFGVDGKKVILESIISVYEDSVSLDNRGSGMESLIKTQIALDKANGLDVIVMEEPENHLCFSALRKMLREISAKKDESQIIITTHSSMIASGLNLNNVLWLTAGKAKSLKKVDEEIADFFAKADNNAFLQLLLSEKIVLVEGATEFILFPKFYQQCMGRTTEEDDISIISCNGISYRKYLSIAEKTGKRVVVITDNDAKTENISDATTFNQSHQLQCIFMDSDISNWTWEVCVYNENKELLDKEISPKEDAQYLYHGKNYGKVLGKMLNNKAETAYQMLVSESKYIVPQYIKDAIKWLNE